VFGTVFNVHGLPRTVISDRDKVFTAHFFTELLRILDVKQRMGTSYQHDFNGAAEVLNKSVEVMLRHVVSEHPERDFDEYLPLIQWSYNSSKHSTTKVTPYYAMWGYEPLHPLDIPQFDKLTILHKPLEAFVKHQQNILIQVRDALIKAQETMEIYENKNKGTPPLFTVGDMLYLSTLNLGKTHIKQTAKKLQPRFIGPYKVVQKLSEYTYKLQLPKSMSRLHPVFHVSLLWKEIPEEDHLKGRLTSNRDDSIPVEENMEDDIPITTEAKANAAEVDEEENDPELFIDEDGSPVFILEKVTQRKSVRNTFHYLVKWKGYSDKDNSWITRKMAVTPTAKQLLNDFDAKLRLDAEVS
jgi:hypothetical protein